jgi:class 3 adenylate cyclase/tetratricopeptide (TPR) repeat protein
MQCPQCQHENPPQAKFCLECGFQFVAACVQCGTQLPAGAKFCLQCGKPTSPAGTQPARFASPQSYTPQHLAEKILTSRSALEGERKQVTVLFADLKGSMELLADRDPEEARKLLDPVLEHMMEAVHRYEGTVNQVMGDGIMALFGAPLAHEDHAVRACYAALRMQEAVKRYAERIRRSDGVAVHIRVGLNSGEVVVRAIGSDLHMDYTAVGQSTHLAARMEQLAVPGSVLITADTLRLAEGYVEVRPLGPVHVKGLAGPVEAYEVTGAGAVRTRLQAAAARGLTRFVGRDEEVEQLRRALEAARAGRGQIAALVGEPGVGKSRLVWELTHSHRTEGWLMLESGSVSYGKATSYLPVIDLLKIYFRIEPRDDPRTVREKVTGKLLTLDRALEPTLPAILALLDAPPGDAAWAALDPTQRRRQTLDAVKRLLLRESQEQPLLLVFEDLHWIDLETQALLDGLVESLPTARTLLLVNYRPEYTHGWGSRTIYTQVRVDPLARASADELLRGLLGDDASLAPLTALLLRRTEGNPLFLEESVRSLVETGALVGERGAYRLAADLDHIRVPAAVQAVLAARIDRLPPAEKRLLQTAAVIGKDVPDAILRAVADGSEEDLQCGLAALQTAEFLYEASLFPELEYTFKHALTHEVAYGSLLQERRRALHAQILDAIERVHADRLLDQVERLARHAYEGEVWPKAIRYLRQAGVRAMGHSAYRDAGGSFERALITLRHLPENRDTLVHAIDLRFALRDVLQPLGEFKRAFDYVREAEPIAEALGDHHRLAWIYSFMGWYYRVMGEHHRAIESGRRALALPGVGDDLFLQLQTSLQLGTAHHSLGEYDQAIAAFSKVITAYEADPPTGPSVGHTGALPVTMRAFPVWSYAEIGAFAEGRALADRALRIAAEVKHPFSLAMAHCVAGHLHIRKGDLAEAIAVLEPGLEHCRVADVSAWLPAIASNLGYAYAFSGRVAEALPLMEEAMPVSTRVTGGHPLWIAWLSEVYLLNGDVEQATPLAERAATLAHERKERGHLAWALRLLAMIAASSMPPDVARAERRYQDALVLARELGMRPLQAHCYLGLGQLYRQSRRTEEACAELSAAIAILRALDMARWLPEAEALLTYQA